MVVCAEPPPKLKIPELTDGANHESPKPERMTRMHHIERHRSCVVTLSDMELSDVQPHCLLETLQVSKSLGGGSQLSLHEETPTDANASHRHAIADAVREALKRSIVYFRGEPIGTVAAIDKSQGATLNYDQVFIRDLIVKNFLAETARLLSGGKMDDLYKLGLGMMPASFKVHYRDATQKTESLLADFGETSIGRVAPVDSGLWWIILLRAYTRWTGDNSLAESPNCQRAMHLILRLCLSEGCDTSPSLLCANGSPVIDRRTGIYGYPIEIQDLFFMAMRCALSMLKQALDADFVNHITKQIQALSYHLHSYYWLDFQRLNDIYRYKTEEHLQTALNKFNVLPESVPDWIIDFVPSCGRYFIDNVTPARMDFRWFGLGNFIVILSSLATGEQAEAILDLVEQRWEEFIGEMPLKICYPAMDNQEWQTVTGCDPKNTWWSYHNGGSWPVLLVAVSVKLGRYLARRVMELDFQGPALHYDQVFMRDFIPSAFAFLMKGEQFIVKNFLVETAHLQSREKMVEHFKLGQGVMPASFKVHHLNPTQKTQKSLAGRVATVLSSWWSKCIGNTDRLFFQCALCGLLYLSLRFNFDYSSTLLSTDDCSLSDICGIPAWLSAARFPDIDPKQLEANYNDTSGFGNTAEVILDELHEFVPSYITGIGRLRWWCETYGWRVDLSPVFKKKIIVFSTPPGGTFVFKLVHKKRVITVSLYGRDLYAMGFRTPHGTFEFKAPSEKRRNFMSGQKVQILPFKKNYRFITPQDAVENIRLGWLSLKQAFEVLYKCQGQTSAVREAVATFAVHFSEAGRIQSTLKDACHISLAQTMETLDSRTNNSMWISDYGNYARQETHRIDSMISGNRPPAIKCPEDQAVTEVQILNNIRIIPRGSYNEGNFELESATLEPTEDDPVLNKAYNDWFKSKNKKLSGSGWGSKQDTGLKVCHYEGIPSSSTYPSYLVEDWCLQEDDGEEKGEGGGKGGGNGGGKGGGDGEGGKGGDGEGGKGGGDGEGDGGKGGNSVVDMSNFKDTEQPFEEFLSHFPSVRRLIGRNTEELNQLNAASTETYSSINRVAFPTIKKKLDTKEFLFKFPPIKTELGAIGRKMLTRTHVIQANHFFRAARVVSRIIRFAL